jgi:predicted transcriptional regulator
VVFGPSGAYKSFYVLGECLSIAQTLPVVYVAAEGSAGLHQRVSAWCKHTGLPPGNIHFICQEISLLDVQHTRALITAITPLKPTFIVFDTLARCIPGGDENTARDMGLAVRHSALIQRELGCAVTWIHHSNRAERGERGSGAMRGAADAMIELMSNGDGIIRLQCSKVKDDEPWPTEELQFHQIDNSGVLIPATGEIASGLSSVEVQILEFLALDVFDTCGANIRAMVAALNITERHIYRILSSLKRADYIMQDKKGDPYSLTAKGGAIIYDRQRRTKLKVVPIRFNPTVGATDIKVSEGTAVDDRV